jgi:hypothetical protein
LSFTPYLITCTEECGRDKHCGYREGVEEVYVKESNKGGRERGGEKKVLGKGWRGFDVFS